VTVTALTIVNGLLDGDPVGVRCVDGRIDAIDEFVTAQDGDAVLDARGGALVPPMVNGHTHAAMTLFRGFGDDMALMEWLETRIWPAEARLTADDVYWGTRLACIEMIRSGTASFADMYWHGPDVARAVADSGLRAWVSTVFLDGGDEARGREQRARVLDELDQIAAAGPLVRASLGPHAVYTVSRPSLAWLGETAAERGAIVQIHCSETEGEVADCIAEHGLRPPELLDALGVLGPSAVLAHGCWFDDGDLDLVADLGATVVTNPVSNMKLAVGRAFPILDAMTRGVPVGLGTDGAASNNGLDLLADVKVLSLLTKHTTGDPSALPAAEALAVARGQRSALLGGHELAVGAPADLVVIDLDEPETAIGDLDAALTYAATGAVVDSTVVAGRVLMEHRVIPGSDDVIAAAREHAVRLRG
jgi:5-methylthioadenosine/S-adenosylhomocysteine deaminase